MLLQVPNGPAVKVERAVGESVLLVNQSGTDVYFDSDVMRMNRTAPGVVPDGTKIAAGGSQVINSWSVPLYFRAVAATTLEVQP
jgi:hypothetical protein